MQRRLNKGSSLEDSGERAAWRRRCRLVRPLVLVALAAIVGALVAVSGGTLGLRPGQSPAAASPGLNEMAVDADHTGSGDTSIQASRVVSGWGNFDTGVNVTVAGDDYGAYQFKVEWNPAVLEFVSGTELMPDGFNVCSGLIVGPGVARAACLRVTGFSTFVGPMDKLTMRCVGDGTSQLHLVTLVEDANLGTSTFEPGQPIATDLVDAQITCGNVFTVTSTADDPDNNPGDGVCMTEGQVCTLRAAIDEANTLPGTDTINFDIPAGGEADGGGEPDPGCDPETGVCTIAPGSGLPTITEPVIIDGYTQPGASANTNPPGQGGNAVLKVVVDGSSAGVGVDGLVITAGSSMVRGLVINSFGFSAIWLQTNGGNVIEGNYIGTDAAGAIGRGNDVGLVIHTSGNTIGGTAPGARNVIAASQETNVGIGGGAAASGNQVLGNFIGTDASGTQALGGVFGIYINGSPGNIIGGPAPGARNVISANYQGVMIGTPESFGNSVQGNFIGTNAAGNAALGNVLGVGIYGGAASNTIGGISPGEGNLISGNSSNGVDIWGSGTTANQVMGNRIGTQADGSPLGNDGQGVGISASGNSVGAGNTVAYNSGAGVYVAGAGNTGNTIRENSIHSNGGGGIENIAGGNNELPPPIIERAGSAIGHTEPPCSGCRVEVFSDDDGQGGIYHGFATTNPDGTWAYLGAVTGPNITATLTDPADNTSEFSAPFRPPQFASFSIAREGLSSLPGGSFDPAGLLVPGPFQQVACGTLGLTYCGGQDDVDALSYGFDFVLPPPDPDNPNTLMYFSVGPGSVGKEGSGVHQEASCATPEAEADEFRTDGRGGNEHAADGDGVGCDGNPVPPAQPFGLVEGGEGGDDLDALADARTQGPYIFFSLDPESPSLPSIPSDGAVASDVLIHEDGGDTWVYAPHFVLGLTPDDDIDAICVADDGDGTYEPGGGEMIGPDHDLIWFSLAPGSPTLSQHYGWSAADVFEGPGVVGPAPLRVISADQLGLLRSDNVDALKCYAYAQPPPPEEQESELGFSIDAQAEPEDKTLEAASDVEIGLQDVDSIDARFGKIVTKGSDWQAVAWGTKIAEGNVEVAIGNKLYKVAAPSGFNNPVEIRTVAPGTVPPDILQMAGVEQVDVFLAATVGGSDFKLYDISTQQAVDLPYDDVGQAWILVVNGADGSKEISFAVSGGALPFYDIKVHSVTGSLLGQSNPVVRENPSVAGYYPVAGVAISQGDPFSGVVYEGLDYACDYFGGTPPGTPPPGSDDDEDCLEDEATALPGRPSEPSADDEPGHGDRDNDGLPDGLEVFYDCDPNLSDTDGDIWNDKYEFIRGTTCRDSDSDDDTVADSVDNCPTKHDSTQTDTDRDGLGDVCDPDDDADGLLDTQEQTIHITLKANTGADPPYEAGFVCESGSWDGALDPKDRDSDDDGVLDGAECLLGSDPTNQVAHQVSVPETCDGQDNDKDGLVDEVPVGLGKEFVTGYCSDSDVDGGSPAPDGLWSGGNTPWGDIMSAEIMFGADCVWKGGTYPPPIPGDPELCLEEDFQNDRDGDGLRGKLDPDGDGDGINDGEEVKRHGTSPSNPDSDRDGCAEGKEVGLNPISGGGRNPLNPYDFYDVPVPTAFNGGTLANRDRAVSILNDVLAVLEYSGTTAGGACNSLGRCYDQDRNSDGQVDGILYDRSAGPVWSDAPDRAVTILTDVLLVLAQSGQSCTAAP